MPKLTIPRKLLTRAKRRRAMVNNLGGVRKDRVDPRLLINNAPECPVHGIRMRVEVTKRLIRYWYCPLDDCKESAKRVRRNLV